MTDDNPRPALQTALIYITGKEACRGYLGGSLQVMSGLVEG